MTIKKLIKRQLIEYLPVLVIFAILALAITLCTCMFLITSFPIKPGGIFANKKSLASSPFPITECLLYIGLVLSTLFPLAVYRYRYSRKKVDFYKSTSCGEITLRRVRIILLLITSLIILTICFIIGFLYQMIEQAIYNSHQQSIEDIYHFNLLYYFLAFLAVLFATVINFFITLFFASLANNQKNAVICVILGHTFLCLLTIAFLSTFIINPSTSDYLYSLSYVNECVLIIGVLNDLTRNLSFQIKVIPFTFITVINFAIAVFGFFYTWFNKDPKAEYAGKQEPCSLVEYILFPSTFFVLFRIMPVYNYGSGGIIYYYYILGISTAYYVTLLIYHKGFRFKPAIYYPIIGVVAFNLLYTIIKSII